MEDNCLIHNLAATRAAYAELGIRKTWWPANSPNLNPIENLWRLLKYRLGKQFLKTIDEARQYVQEEWEKIQIEDYTGYIKSMRARCEAVIAAGGGHTRW